MAEGQNDVIFAIINNKLSNYYDYLFLLQSVTKTRN